ncbi:MAG: tetratricopeptide repeat protein [Pirellulales bacterium]
MAGFCAAFVVILLVRFEVVDSPPFWDSIMAVWNEADYLAQSDFDYDGLLNRTRYCLHPDGGRRAYGATIIPGVIALLMRNTPTPHAAIVCYHLLIFFCSACSAVLFFELVRPLTTPLGALLATLAAWTTPVFAVQIDLLGMEPPLIACALLNVYLISKGRTGWAAAAALGAFAVKQSGFIVVAANIAFLFGIRLNELRQGHRAGDRSRYLLLHVAVALLEILVISSGDTHTKNMRGGANWIAALTWCPDVVFLVIACLALGLLRALAWRRREPDAGLLARTPNAIGSTWVLAGWTAVLALLATGFVPFLPRYVALAVPFIYLVFAALMLTTPRSTTPAMIAFAFFTLFNLANWNGRFFPDVNALPKWASSVPFARIAREPGHLERSHEYLHDHLCTQEVVEKIKTLAPEQPVLCGFPFTYILALPSLGYVDRPIATYAIQGFYDYTATSRDVAQLCRDHPPHPIFVLSENTFYRNFSQFDSPPPESGTVLYEDNDPGQLVVFRSAEPDSAWDRTRIEAWYRDRSFPGDSLDWHFARLWNTEQLDRFCEAAAEYQSRNYDWPTPIALAAALCRQGRERDAAEAYFKAISHDWDRGCRVGPLPHVIARTKPLVPDQTPDEARQLAKLLRAVEERYHGHDGAWQAADYCVRRYAAALADPYLEVYLEATNPRVRAAVAPNRDGWSALASLDLTDARRQFEMALVARADFPPALIGLGIVAYLENRYDDAEQALAEALRLAPQSQEAAYHLGLVRRARNEALKGSHNRSALPAPSNRRFAQIQLAPEATGNATNEHVYDSHGQQRHD